MTDKVITEFTYITKISDKERDKIMSWADSIFKRQKNGQIWTGRTKLVENPFLAILSKDKP